MVTSSSSTSTISAVTAVTAVTALVTGIAISAAVATAVASQKKEKKEDPFKPTVTISLPTWLYEYYDSLKDVLYTTDEEMMDVAIEISSKNVKEGTGGPFGCAIFERRTTTSSSSSSTSTSIQLFAVGANRVTVLNNSTLHGEMVAIQFAQSKLQNYTMRTTKSNSVTPTSTDPKNVSTHVDYILATSCEPCCMCLGGTLWSGVSELLCGATKFDAESIGFNEGPVFDPMSYDALKVAGITIKKGILQAKAAAVLQEYAKTGEIYNC